MNPSSTPADPTMILIAGVIFSLVIIVLAVSALWVVRKRNSRTGTPSARIKSIASLSDEMAIGPAATRSKKGVAAAAGLGDYIHAPKTTPQTTLSAAITAKLPSEVIQPKVNTSQLQIEKTVETPGPEVMEIAAQPEVIEASLKNESSGAKPTIEADDPFAVFNEVSLEQSPTSKFAATLGDVDVNNLNQQVQDLWRTLKARS